MRFCIILIFTLCCICSGAHASNYKKYSIKSGKVEYLISGSTRGTQTLYWDNYGYKELLVEKSQTEIMGQISQGYQSTLVLGSNIYTWSENDDKIYLTNNSLNKTWIDNNYTDDNIESYVNEIFRQSGYEKDRTEIFLGKKCEVFKGLGELWVWKGITIKNEINLVGTHTQIIAVDADINWEVQSSKFLIPSGYEVIHIDDIDNKIDKENSGEEETLSPAKMEKMLEGLLKTNEND